MKPINIFFLDGASIKQATSHCRMDYIFGRHFWSLPFAARDYAYLTYLCSLY
jgi:hypothetical protein